MATQEKIPEEALRNRTPGAFQGAHVFRLDPKADISKMDDQDLLFSHSMCHAFFANMSRAIKVKNWTKEALLAHHTTIIKEMAKRKMLISVTADEMGESVKALVAKSLGQEDVGETLVQPKIQGAKKKPLKAPTIKKVFSDPEQPLPVDPDEVMAKALEFFSLYQAQSVLKVLHIAEHSGILTEIEAHDAQEEEDATDPGGSADR